MGSRRETQVTLDLHEDGLILCENGVSLSHGRLSASHPVCEGCMGSTNDDDVEENVRTTSMMVRKSRVEIVVCCEGGAEVLATTLSVGRYWGQGALKRQRAMELAVLEPEGEMQGLRVSEPEAPQYAPLKGAALQQEYQ